MTAGKNNISTLSAKRKRICRRRKRKHTAMERASKYPKSTRYGRQNPIAGSVGTARSSCKIWRMNWADIDNLTSWSVQTSDSRIDHRSHKARGLDEQPTIHEGVSARIIETKGRTLPSAANSTGRSRQITNCSVSLKSSMQNLLKQLNILSHLFQRFLKPCVKI